MKITDLKGKKVCILGYGIEGQATLRAMNTYAPEAEITIADRNESEVEKKNFQFSIFNFQFGESYLGNLDHFDVIIKSPGIPPLPELEAVAEKITNSTQIFLDTVHDKRSSVVGVTGSKGKSTTASLIAAMLQADGRDAHLVGNIGIPTLDFLDKASEGTIFVQEMSSYQLMDLTVSPHLAVITAFFPDHLDYHGSLEAYKAAKMHITKFQGPDDYVFYDASSVGATEIAEQSPGTKVAAEEADSVVRIDETHLLGQHNLRNLALASLLGEHFGVEKQTVRKALVQFKGLAHRLQSLGVHHGLEWVDDAISTTPESTIAGIQALGDRVFAIILGGQNRGYDFSELGQVVADSSIQHVILFPDSGPKIREAIEQAGAKVEFAEAGSMEEAVQLARTCHTEHVTPSTVEGRSATSSEPVPSFDGAQDDTVSICLLSTASPSYNMFKNFEAKGDAFADAIRASNH